MRSLRGGSMVIGSMMTTGCGWCTMISSRSSSKISSRSRMAFLPITRSSARSRCCLRDCTKPSSQAPMRSATCIQEKPKTSAAPITPRPMDTKPEPEKPNHFTLSGPSKYPSAPPLRSGRLGSRLYKRAHSSEVLAYSSRTKPIQNTNLWGTARPPASPRRRLANRANHSRTPTATHHQTE